MVDYIHVCVFHSRKTGFKKWLDTSSIPCYISSFSGFFLSQSQYLLDTWWINQESSCLLDSFSTPGGSIKFLFLDLMSCSSIPARYLSYQWPFPRYLPRHLHLSFTEGLYILSSRSVSHFFDLSRSVRTCSSPKHSLSHSKPLPLWFFKLFQDFLLLVSF